MHGCHTDSIDMPECISMAKIQQASSQDDHLQQLKKSIIAGWPNTKDELHANIRPHWPYRDKLSVIDGIILQGRHIVIPYSLRQQVLTQLHRSQMGIEKTKLLACDSVFWSNINTDIEGYIKHCATCLKFQQTQPKEKITHHDIPRRPWEVVAQTYFISKINTTCVL